MGRIPTPPAVNSLRPETNQVQNTPLLRTPSQRLHSSSIMSTPSTCQIGDLIQKLPKLGISEIPISPSPSSSAPVQPVHFSPPRMDPPRSLVVNSPQADRDQPMLRPLTASTVHFRAPAPHLRRYL